MVDAIDKKSAYTRDHCRRVPILAKLITDAACDEDEGPLKDFSLTSDELQIADLLHDCGKVTTPVHVMDKATKLEAIIDRIELIRIRGEILKRDLELDALRERVAGRCPIQTRIRPGSKPHESSKRISGSSNSATSAARRRPTKPSRESTP